MRDDFYRWMIPSYREKSVKTDDCWRYMVAEKEAGKKAVKLDAIIQYVNEFLTSIDIEPVEQPKINCDEQFKSNLKEARSHLTDKCDIVWMKFTLDGYLGVVACGNDINFSEDTSSWRIINHLGKKWDESFVLVFPLIKSSESHTTLNRHLIESGIGNYLASQNVPILDFYSHNF